MSCDQIGRAIGLSMVIVGWASVPAQAQDPIPRDSTPLVAPCPDQPWSIGDLVEAFEGGRRPDALALGRTWVAIGFVREPQNLDCDGVRRGPAFEWVLDPAGDSVEIDLIGMPPMTRPQDRDSRGSLTFPVEFGGESVLTYRCRMTARDTLACLSGEGDWIDGIEFRAMEVRDEQRASSYRDP